MAKRKNKISKLSKEQKKRIGLNPFRYKPENYAKSARAYITKEQKNRKEQDEKKKYIKVGGLMVKEKSDAYRFIKSFADEKQMSVKAFAKENAEHLFPLLEKRMMQIPRDGDNIIKDIHFSFGKVTLNGKSISKVDAQLALAKYIKEIKTATGAFSVSPPVRATLTGDIHLELPPIPKLKKQKGKAFTFDQVNSYFDDWEKFEKESGVKLVKSDKRKKKSMSGFVSKRLKQVGQKRLRKRA